jgi:hypothetical protein
VQPLKRRYLPNSADWVRHGNRGKPRSGALGQPLCQRVLALACGKYAGFNDSHLRQKLVENEGLSLSRESVRRILRKAKRRRSRSLIFVLCPAPSTWLVVSAFVVSGWSPRITPWPGQEKFFSFLRSPPAAALAGKVVELSHQLDGSLRFYSGQQLLLTLQRPLEELVEPKPAILSSALKRRPKPPRIYTLGGRPALSAAT